jgi:SMODS-associating 2TM, beta-strand rich effector domain
MNTHNLRIYAFVMLGLAFGTYVILFLFTQNLQNINFEKAISNISTTISINIIVWTIFIKWLWKWKIFYPWLVQFPNLSGEWEGIIKSNWDKEKITEIPLTVIIYQNFFNIQVKIKTEESKSYSIGASFDIDKDRGQQQLFYSYLNTPNSSVRNRSEIHYGSTILNFDGCNVKELEGEYWTSRETTGEIKLRKKNCA